jgi:hypothetical protein
MQPKFKIGDKIVCVDVNGDNVGWEGYDFTEMRPDEGRVYTVEAVNYTSPDPDIHSVAIRVQGGPWYYHPSHFRYAKMTNEERIKKREEDLCSQKDRK